MSNWFLNVVRWRALLRHPRVSIWYWRINRYKKVPDPAIPKTLNEKFFWRKVFDRNPEFVEVSDKIQVRGWLEKNQIDIKAPEILWRGNDPDRTAFNRLMKKYLRKRQGRKRFEWAYFGITPELFVEKLVPGITTEFKAYTFGSRIERLVVIYDRFGDQSADAWMPDGEGGWKRAAGKASVAKQANRPLPTLAHDALKVSEQMGRHFDHMRVDILSDERELWFSELTIYNMGGFMGSFMPHFGGDETDPMNLSWNIEESCTECNLHQLVAQPQFSITSKSWCRSRRSCWRWGFL